MSFNNDLMLYIEPSFPTAWIILLALDLSLLITILLIIQIKYGARNDEARRNIDKEKTSY